MLQDANFKMLKVGFPIRKSWDQRLFAPSRSLSQRTTSFIASYRQGIHQMPLSHLIALISNAHPVLTCSLQSEEGCRSQVDTRLGWSLHFRKTRSQNKPVTPSHLRSQKPSPPRPGLRLATALERAGFWPALGRVPSLRCQDHRLRTCRGGMRYSSNTDAEWWSQTGSNRRPHACKARALPAELWPRNQKTNASQRSLSCISFKRKRTRSNGGPGKT